MAAIHRPGQRLGALPACSSSNADNCAACTSTPAVEAESGVATRSDKPSAEEPTSTSRPDSAATGVREFRISAAAITVYAGQLRANGMREKVSLM